MQFVRSILFGRSAKASSQQLQVGSSTAAGQHAVPRPSPAPSRRASPSWGMPGAETRTVSASQAAADGAAPSTSAPAVTVAPPPAANAPARLKLVIVGDVHGAWYGEREAAALELLGPDLTLLVGDFGEEDVQLVKEVSELPLPKAVILGNHDAWYTMTGRRSRKAAAAAPSPPPSSSPSSSPSAAPPPPPADDVDQQLAALGRCHVGYGSMPLEERGYTVVGARPFSKGGRDFGSIRSFMGRLYGVSSMQESAHRIAQAAQSAPPHHALLLMGHNGPAGLGSAHHDICGVDWEASGGDHGDPDLQTALQMLHRAGRRVPLVTFGHMHHALHRSARIAPGTQRLRRMVALDPATGTVFLNAATVPRVTLAPTSAPPSPPPSPPRSQSQALPRSGKDPLSPKAYGSGRRARVAAKAAAAAAAAAVRGAATAAKAATAKAGAQGSDPRATLHHFMVAELEAGEVVTARDVWVQVTPVVDATAEAVLQAVAAATTAAATGSSVPATTSVAASGDGSGNGDGVDSVPGAHKVEESGGGGDGGASYRGDGGGGDEDDACGATPGPRRVGDFVVQVAREHVVLRTARGAEGGGVVKFLWNAHEARYEAVVLGGGVAGDAGGGGGVGGRWSVVGRLLGGLRRA